MQLTNIFNKMFSAIIFVIILSVITGILYPLCITAISQVLFPAQANGSLIEYQGKIIGSALIGQHFSANKYFWGRPSATQPFPYNAAVSAGSNLGPSNPILLEQITQRSKNLIQKNPQAIGAIPIDLVTTSASGLDPHITLNAALYQAQRVSQARKVPIKTIEDLIIDSSKLYNWGIFGQPRVNVLQLNLALDQLNSQRKS